MFYIQIRNFIEIPVIFSKSGSLSMESYGLKRSNEVVI